MSSRYIDYTTTFSAHFRSGNHDVSSQSNAYLRGLMQSQKRNMERMAEVVPETDEQVLQNFLTHSSWDHQGIIAQVSKEADSWLGGDVGTGLYIDESAFTKKGKKSVGVARQWNGRLGKTDNCQVGVFAALGKDKHVSLIDAKLYLPKEWLEDPHRCAEADIPRTEQVLKTKHDLALEIVAQARERAVRFEWIGMDGFYGMSLNLLQTLDKQGEVFMADIHKDRHIYLSNPEPYLPESPAKKGRKRHRYQSDEFAVEVQKWVGDQPDSAWKRKTIREGDKGKLIVEVLHQVVWIWDKSSATANQWHLIVRRELNAPNTLKYSLCNAPERTSVLRLARMQAQRYWIERAFQDAKSYIGMGHYQARKWASWYRHMALVMMAQQFMLQERLQKTEAYPLLSCYDIQILLATTLPSRQNNEQDVLALMKERHRKRQAAIDSSRERQRYELRKR
jgi:SRSO17 transposase